MIRRLTVSDAPALPPLPDEGREECDNNAANPEGLDKIDRHTFVSCQEISYNELEFSSPKKLLGRGSSAAVIYARYRQQPVAIKEVTGNFFSIDENTDTLKNECEKLSDFDHPNILKLYGWVKGPRFSLVLEFQPFDLFTVIKKVGDRTVDYVQIGHDIVTALDAMHKKNMIHRDVKIENILMNTDGHAKLCDFGFAARLGPDGVIFAKKLMGTPAYMAPEVIREKKYSTQSDMYAFGIAWWEMLSHFSFMSRYSRTQEGIIPFVLAGVREIIPDDCDPDVAELIVRCWDGLPEMRPGAAEVREVLSRKLHNRDKENIERCRFFQGKRDRDESIPGEFRRLVM